MTGIRQLKLGLVNQNLSTFNLICSFKPCNMKLIRSVLLSTLLLLMFNDAFGQAREIKGKVTDSTGVPLAGATVATDQKTRSTVTDAEGNYKIRVDDKTTSLIF